MRTKRNAHLVAESQHERLRRRHFLLLLAHRKLLRLESITLDTHKHQFVGGARPERQARVGRQLHASVTINLTNLKVEVSVVEEQVVRCYCDD